MINKDAYLKLKEELDPLDVKIIAVSKRQAPEKITELYDLGHRDFGENLVQAMVKRYEDFAELDINWHLIGHLQRNKVKYITSFTHLIHSTDSLRLLAEINKRSARDDKVLDCLLQIHIAEEETKFGLDEKEVKQILDDGSFQSLKNIRICGLMGMATFTDNTVQVRKEFRGLRKLYDSLKTSYFQSNTDFNILSMGMSDDYKIAVDEGSNMLRIGTKIFGPRENK